MTLLNRPTRPLGRKHRQARDDRVFVIATEDTYAPKQYFEEIRLARVKIHVVENTDGRPAAPDVLNRLREVYEGAKARNEVLDEDQFWMVVDTDHYTSGQHLPTFTRALKEASDAGFRTAVSNPCFEYWLLLHLESPSTEYADGSAVEARLKALLGSFNKCSIDPARFLEKVSDAVRRAAAMAQANHGWPQSNGTQVHLLVTELGLGIAQANQACPHR